MQALVQGIVRIIIRTRIESIVYTRMCVNFQGAWLVTEVREAVTDAAMELAYPDLKPEQLEIVETFVKRRDVFAVLLTGRVSVSVVCLLCSINCWVEMWPFAFRLHGVLKNKLTKLMLRNLSEVMTFKWNKTWHAPRAYALVGVATCAWTLDRLILPIDI